MKFNKILIIFLSPIFIYCQEFHVDKEKDNEVRFTSRTQIHEFDGVTSKIDGYVLVKDDETSEFYFEVPLQTFDTGIGLRNRHMRENYLETDKYPYGIYNGSIESWAEVGDTLHVASKGKMLIHGQEKIMICNAKLTQTENGYKGISTFVINLKDYNIKIPSAMMMKLNENIDVKVRIYFKEVN